MHIARPLATATLLLTALLLMLPACGSAVTTDCEEAAQAQCDLCDECAVPAPADNSVRGISGAALCQISTSSNNSDCVKLLTSKCEEQATGRQQTNEEIQTCTESIETVACEKLHQAYALDKSIATPQCARYF